MKTSRTAGVGLLVIVSILFLTAKGRAGIPEPDVIYYGTARYGANSATEGQKITLVLDATSEQVAAYELGSIPEYEDHYVVRVPMGAFASIEGRAASFYIDGSLAGTTPIYPKGSVVPLDLDTITYNDSDQDGLDDTWEMQQFGTLQLGPGDDINGDGVTNLVHQEKKTDPAAAVWGEAADGYRETCVFHPLVLQKALDEAATDGSHSRIKLQTEPFDALDTYAGNFSYTALWGEDFDLEIVGGYDTGCQASDTALTVLDGDVNGDDAGDGPVLTLDTATGQTSGNVRVENLHITNGSALEGGGIAVVTHTGDVTLLNNIITGNSSTEVGGGISLHAQGAAQTLLVASNTIDGNEGGGIYCNSPQASPVIMNNIITNSLNGEGIRAEGAAPDSDYNNLWNNEGGGYNDPAFQGDHDLSVDPLFADAAGGDFSLQGASLCVDVGKNADWLPELDIQGNQRITDGNSDNVFRVDMGAYESAGAIPPDDPVVCDPVVDEDCDEVLDEADQCAGLDDRIDTDGNTLPDCSEDGDGDGMPNWWEAKYSEYNGGPGLDPTTDDSGLDLDGDGFSNFQEYLAGTYPNNADPDVPDAVPPNQAPAVPKPTAPANQSKVTTLPFALVVENAGDDDLTPPFYEFVVYTAEDMTNPVATSGDVSEESGLTTSWPVDNDDVEAFSEALVENTLYRWRVRAKDDPQNASAWSNYFNFFVNTANEAPTEPSLNSPQDGEEVQTPLPTLVIDNATDVDQDALIYRFEVDKVDTFDSGENQLPLIASPDIQEGADGATSWTSSALDENTPYYWRARACDAVECGDWMTTADFLVNTINDPPSIPEISAPPDGSQLAVFQPELEVTNASDPDGDTLTYEFQLYADNGMNTLITSTAGIRQAWDGATSWQVDELLQNHRTYWWRAQARDDEGEASGWSVLFSFTVSTTNKPPYGFSIVTPPNGIEVQTLAPSLVINNAADDNMDPITYYFDIDKINTFNSTALQRSPRIPEGVLGITSWRPPLPLTDGTTYFWRVIAYDGASYSDWTTWSFKVNLDNDPPTEIEISTPKGGAEVRTLAPSLVVKNATDDNMDPITYFFEIDKVKAYNSTARRQSPRIPQGAGGITSWRPAALDDNTTYHWRVIAYDGASYNEWVEGSFFVNLANDPPETPTIQGPGEGDEVDALSPDLTVNVATDVDGDHLTYDYEVYADPNGTYLVSSAEGEGTSWQPDGLDDNTYYWWRFRSRDDEGALSAWSTLSVFFVNTVNDAPSAPSVNSPRDGEDVETLEPALEVNNAHDVDRDMLTYEFEIDTVSTFSSEDKRSGSVPQDGANTTSWRLSELKEHTTYYWRARACDEDNCSEWMQTAGFFVNTSNEPPSAPNISAPPDGSQVTTSRPTLEVTNASDPDNDLMTYEFELYSDDDMDRLITWKTVVLEEKDGTTSWRVYKGLKNKKTYWWRFQARDDEGAPSGWSDLYSFKVDTKNDAPEAPSIFNPQDGGEVDSLAPVLEVNNSEDENRDTLTYFFEIDNVNTFDSPALQQSLETDEGAGGTTWRPDPLADNTMYYWRVRAYDGEAYGDWGTGSFFVNEANEPPDTPTLQNPGEGCVLTVSSPTLSVYSDTDADLDEISYDYELYDSDPDHNLNDRISSVTGAGASWQVDVSLADHVLYYWRAKACDADDQDSCSGWSSAVAFSVNAANARPGAPTLNNPFNGGIVTKLKPTLSVNNAADPDDERLIYEFELFSDQGLTEQVASAALSQGDLITSWTVDSVLADNRTYYWRARSYDGSLRSSWMATALFMVSTRGVVTKIEPVCAEDVYASAETTQTVEVTERGCPLKHVTVEIPPGALMEDCTITIGMVSNPPALPENTKAINRIIEFGPEGTTFAKPVTVRIPYTWADLDDAGVWNPNLLEVWTFNTATLTWEQVPIDHVDGWFLVCKLEHFSSYAMGLPVSSAASTGTASTGAASAGGSGGCFIATMAQGPHWHILLVFVIVILLISVCWRISGRISKNCNRSRGV